MTVDLSNKDDPLAVLLKWGIENSDPEKLKELRQASTSENITTKFDKELVDFILGCDKEKDQISDLLACLFDSFNNSFEVRKEKFDILIDLFDDNPNLCFSIEKNSLWPGILDYLQGNKEERERIEERELFCQFIGRFLKEILSNNSIIQKQFVLAGGIKIILGMMEKESDSLVKSSLCSLLFVIIIGDIEFAKEAIGLGLVRVISPSNYCNEKFVIVALRIFSFLHEQFGLLEWNDFKIVFDFVMNSEMSVEVKELSTNVCTLFQQKYANNNLISS